MPFRFGYIPDENVAADDHVAGDWLFQEGYLNGTMRLEDDNALSLTYTVSLWILSESKLADRPEDRGPQLLGLMTRLQRVYRKIADHGSIGPGQFEEGINILDRNVDGIRLKFSFTPLLPLSIC